MIIFSNQVLVLHREVNADGAFQVARLQRHHKTMRIASTVYSERLLVRLVRDTVEHTRPKHHSVAAHVIVHDVFQSWEKRLRIHEIKIYALICSDLNSLVASNKVDEAAHIQLVVLAPLGALPLMSYQGGEVIHVAHFIALRLRVEYDI